jgi:peptide deformylase
MGVGIAAVQVGIPERFAIIQLPKYGKKVFTIINPQIVKQSEEKLLYPEMCMSAHPCIAPVVRPAWIEFTYFDDNGEKHVWDKKADDEEGKRFNRVFQHEIDHLNGFINIDHVQSKDIIFESDPVFYSSATFIKI